MTSVINATRKDTMRGTAPTSHRRVVVVVVEENVITAASQDILRVNAPTSVAIVSVAGVEVGKANAISAEGMVTSLASAQLIAAKATVVRNVIIVASLDIFPVNAQIPDPTSQSDVTIVSNLDISVATVLRPQVTAMIERRALRRGGDGDEARVHVFEAMCGSMHGFPTFRLDLCCVFIISL